MKYHLFTETAHLKREMGLSPFPSREIYIYDILRRRNLFCKQNRVVFFPAFSCFFFVFTQTEFTVNKICDDNNVGT